MSRLLKPALLWLMMLALPVQGAAAAAMLYCGPLHERMAAAAETTHGASANHRHVGSGAHRGAEHVHSTAAVHDVNGTDATLSGVDDFSKLTGFSCSACSACCSGAAITGSDYRAPDFSAPVTVFRSARASSFSGFIPEGPEHPPRSILA